MEIPVALVAPRIGSGRYIFVEFVDPLGVDFNKIYATVNILKTPKTTFIKHSPSSWVNSFLAVHEISRG